MAGKCRRCLQFASEANPIEYGLEPSQTQQIKVAAFCGQVYPRQCSPLETINRETCIYFLQYYSYSILTINNHVLYKYTTQAGEQALKGCKVGKKHFLFFKG